MKNRTLAIIMAAMLSNEALQAAEADSGFMGKEVVVSATKTLNSVRNTGGSSVTVITAKEIKNSGQPTVLEVIKGTTGIDIASNGGAGSNSSVYLRGADAKYTLVLIDGVPTNDPSDGTRAPNLSNVTVDNIEQIEIVRGPSSMLYGSGASAGIINIITKKAGLKPESSLGAEGGSYGTCKYYGGTNGRRGVVDYAVSFSRMKSDGFSSTDQRNQYINPTESSFEHDGYDNTTLSGNIGLKLDDHLRLETVVRYTDANVEYDSPGVDVVGSEQDSQQYSGRITLKMDYQPLLGTLYYGFSSQDRSYLDNGALSDTYNGYLYEIGWQGDLKVTQNNTVSVGLNGQHESIAQESFGAFASSIDRDIASNAIFCEDQWHIGNLQLFGGIRYEDNEKNGDKTTFRIAPSWSFGDTLIKFSYATGFRSPSLYELYSAYGNEQLKAESSRGWDAGIEHKLGERLSAGTTLFRTDYEDRIAFDLSTWVYGQAAGGTRTEGVESFLEWRPEAPVSMTLNHTYTYTQDANDQELLRRPRNKVGLFCSWKATERLWLNTNMKWVSSRRDSGARDGDGVVTGKLDSYTLVNLSALYRLSETFELNGRLDNLFDAHYEEAWRYATVGRSAFAGVKVTF
ncbi:MAG: TonB-dependent receptor [Chlorobiaceae bacterium]|nr:TonB-dependent receptor [Chlorobiaceae bacterium]